MLCLLSLFHPQPVVQDYRTHQLIATEDEAGHSRRPELHEAVISMYLIPVVYVAAVDAAIFNVGASVGNDGEKDHEQDIRACTDPDVL